MNAGDIILINFPFTIPTVSKVRPAVVIAVTDDRYRDLVVCAISSVIPDTPSKREIVFNSTDDDFNQTGLRANSVVKVDRIATLRESDVITRIGKCSPRQWKLIVDAFQNLVSV